MYQRLYQYVLAVAKHGSITIAANELFITPSTLSKAIQGLEQDLGVPLFDRVGKRFSPTFAGEQFLRRAEEIVNIQREMQAELRDIAALRAGRIRIGLQLNTARRTIQAIGIFHKLYPDIEIQVFEDNSASLSEQLAKGNVDLMIANADPDIQKNFDLTVLSNTKLILVLPKTHPIIKKAVWIGDGKYPTIQLSQCRDELFILPPPNQRMGVVLKELLTANGIPSHTKIYATTIGTILRLVAEGLGITITFDQTAETFERELNLAILQFDHAQNQSLIAATCPNHYVSEAVRHFIRICEEIFQDNMSESSLYGIHTPPSST